MTALRIPSFIATYGMMWMLTGVTYYYMAGETIHGFPPEFRQLGSGYLLGVPMPVYVMVLFLLIGGLFAQRTVWGQQIYAIGANPVTARLSGVPVERRLVLVYAVSGAMAGLASLIILARINSAQGDIGEDLTLPAIAAVLVGGTSLFGGSGTVAGTLIGALILTLVLNGMNLLQINSSWQPLVTGVIVLLAVWIDTPDATHDMRLRRATGSLENREQRKCGTIIMAMPLVAALAAGAALADGETIAVFTKNQTNPYFQAVRVGTETAAKTLGVKVIQYVPTKPDSIPEQLSQVEDVIVKKPNAIVFIPVDYKALVPAVEKINAAGIPVTNITDRSAGGNFVAFVGADDYSIGLATARFLLKAMGGKGNVVILEGVKGSLTSTNRVRGFNDALKENPNVKLLASQPANYQRLAALQVMENLMQSHPQIDGVLAANDPMAVGAIEALEGANRKALVIGINGSKEAVELIKSGKLLASGDFNGFIQGCIGTEIAILHVRKKPTPAQVLLKPVVIDKTNFQPYEMPVEQRPCPKLEDVVTN